MVRRRGSATYFADENLRGLGVLLRRAGRDDVVYPGHEELPEVPVGTSDVEWMHVVARMDMIVLTRDKHIRTRPAELAAYRELGIRSVWLGSKRDLGPRDQLELFLGHEERLTRWATKLGGGPWALAMSPTGVRQLRLRSER